jgi:hypothetical protein
MAMTMTRRRGYEASQRDLYWLNLIPEALLFATLLKRLDNEPAAFCRGYLEALRDEHIITPGEVHTLFEALQKPHWLAGWCPQKT